MPCMGQHDNDPATDTVSSKEAASRDGVHMSHVSLVCQDAAGTLQASTRELMLTCICTAGLCVIADVDGDVAVAEHADTAANGWPA